ncbi:uncharacterized protein LOC131349006 isoform X1 [Hemibagrus wyckioides]|uniref:uncharacterized protein LOC131349006 isoform X1 n=1 Tax=Hemibagrus wyckioides TaxID=337641 RepID=UPI00266CD8AD|nr:uncharacterized protein LOC131349006 isoform X1 [Hemibagrus wyckioides]XP_058240291.1 uncharacterized protein LOC131349006 isoform X1 [Hemibagrus wyckioides]
MPKASCTICRKMVPLQALPVHIKSCRKENIDLCSTSEDEAFTQDHLPPVCPENQAELTAECPVCRGAFDIDVTETHASDCGLRTADQEGNGSILSEAMNSFQSDIFSRGMQQWQRQKKSSPKFRLKGSFFGESGIDTGALSKEFLTEMLAEIEKKLFLGSTDKKGKNLLYCLNRLDHNYFRTAGEVIAASMAQGGPLPNFMCEWCFRYLCSGNSDSIQVSTTDVTDLELSQLIMKVNRATDESINELIDDIINCGSTGRVSVGKKRTHNQGYCTALSHESCPHA